MSMRVGDVCSFVRQVQGHVEVFDFREHVFQHFIVRDGVFVHDPRVGEIRFVFRVLPCDFRFQDKFCSLDTRGSRT